MKADLWPSLPLEEWQDTYATLHMWTQVIGKIKVELTPLMNHWWNVPLYVSSRGLTTSLIPYRNKSFEIDFDFIDHQLILRCDDGMIKNLPLVPRSVAGFYSEVMRLLDELGIDVKIWTTPVEVPDPIPFEQDYQHYSYDAEYVQRFWRILLSVDRIFREFRSHFIGKVSPVHFFWGSFDLAVTRFSGRRAPERVGADSITREAYSHEVISHGFWPGGGQVAGAAFYSYTAPEPSGLKEAEIKPPAAYYSKELSEFILMYDDLRQSNSPEETLKEFLQSTYEVGANLAGWERTDLERQW